MRTFDSGATRDNDISKIDYDGFLSPQVLKRYGQYMLTHQKQADGQMRASDNWKKGIPRDAYMKSMFRHFMEVWDEHAEAARFVAAGDTVEMQRDDLTLFQRREEALCALLFNVMGYLHELEEGR